MRLILTLPLPPTDNRRLNGAQRPTPEYDSWKNKARMHWNDFIFELPVGQRWELDEPSYLEQYTYDIVIFMRDERADFTNYVKCLKDFGTNKIYTDDKWVGVKINMPVHKDKNNPRVEWNLVPTIHKLIPGHLTYPKGW